MKVSTELRFLWYTITAAAPPTNMRRSDIHVKVTMIARLRAVNGTQWWYFDIIVYRPLLQTELPTTKSKLQVVKSLSN